MEIFDWAIGVGCNDTLQYILSKYSSCENYILT